MASIRHILVAIAAATLSVPAGAAQAGEAIAPATVSVQTAIRLPGTSGDEVVLAPSTYTVEAIGTFGLRITGADGTSRTIHATAHKVDARPDHASAVLAVRPDGEHLVLTLPSGLELDAAGTVEGIRSRAVAPITTVRAPVAATPVPVFIPPPAPPIVTAPVTVKPPVNPVNYDICSGLSNTPPPALIPMGAPGAPVYSSTPAAISKVIPLSFAPGATVTICGKGLGIIPQDNYSPTYVNPFPGTIVDVSTLHLVAGYFVRLQAGVQDPNAWDNDTRIQAVNPMVSASGDRIVFTAGAPFEPTLDCDHNVSSNCFSGNNGLFLDPVSPYASWAPLVWQSSYSGPLDLEQWGVGLVIGPSLTWHSP